MEKNSVKTTMIRATMAAMPVAEKGNKRAAANRPLMLVGVDRRAVTCTAASEQSRTCTGSRAFKSESSNIAVEKMMGRLLVVVGVVAEAEDVRNSAVVETGRLEEEDKAKEEEGEAAEEEEETVVDKR